MLTLTVVEAPASVPAAPANSGLLLFVIEPLVGSVRVTGGGVVFSVKVAGLLLPSFPALSFCVAWAVYSPGLRAAVGEVDHAPALAVVVNVCRGVPDALPPEYRFTVIAG